MVEFIYYSRVIGLRLFTGLGKKASVMHDLGIEFLERELP